MMTGPMPRIFPLRSKHSPKLYFENTAGRLLEHPGGYVVLEYKPGKRKLSDLQALLAPVRNLLECNQ